MISITACINEITNHVLKYDVDTDKCANLSDKIRELGLYSENEDIADEQYTQVIDLIVDHDVDEISEEGIPVAVLLTILVTDSIGFFCWDGYVEELNYLKSWMEA